MLVATRRTVLTAVGAGAAICAVGAPSFAAAGAVPTRAQLASLVGGDVTLRSSAGSRVRARVVNVGDLVARPVDDPRCYSALLRPRSHLPDGIYQVVAPGLDSSSLFLANVDRHGGAGLEAIVLPISIGGLHG